MGKYYSVFQKSIMAGIFIGLGCIAYLSCDNKVVGAFLFSIGLLSVLECQALLFTGAICRSVKADTLTVIYIGNFVGIALMAVLARFSGIVEIVDMSVRVSRPFYQIWLRGIICEICIYIAVITYDRFQHPLFVVLPVMAFILCGSEHCIADMFYLLLSSDPNVRTIFFIPFVTLGNVIGAFLMRCVAHQKTEDLEF